MASVKSPDELDLLIPVVRDQTTWVHSGAAERDAATVEGVRLAGPHLVHVEYTGAWSAWSLKARPR
jgi:hypothetical protein